MATCAITNKKGMQGNRVSHANNKTKHRQMASVESKRVWDDQAKRWVRIKISKRGLRFLNKMTLSELRRKHAVTL